MPHSFARGPSRGESLHDLEEPVAWNRSELGVPADLRQHLERGAGLPRPRVQRHENLELLHPFSGGVDPREDFTQRALRVRLDDVLRDRVGAHRLAHGKDAAHVVTLESPGNAPHLEFHRVEELGDGQVARQRATRRWLRDDLARVRVEAEPIPGRRRPRS